MAKVVCYCRVSTENQEAEGTSLETQERACLAKAHELAGPGDDQVVLREVYSGLALERPELSRLREWVRTGQVGAVVVYAADRLARDGLHLLLLVEEIEKAGATLAFVTEPHQSTPEGQLLTFVRGWASKLEALKIKERTVRGRKERARSGRLPSNGPLYGYLFLKGKGESRGIRIPDSDKSPIVRNIFQWYAVEGLSLKGVIRRLQAQGVPSPTGKAAWSIAQLDKLLVNEAYAGRTVIHWRAFGREDIEVLGASPALVERALWEAAQERLKLNREMMGRNIKRDYPLRGFIWCSQCGGRLRGVAQGAKPYRRYYYCQKHRPFTGGRAEGLESEVAQAVSRILTDPALVKTQVERLRASQGDNGSRERLETVEKRLKALERGWNRWPAWWVRAF